MEKELVQRRGIDELLDQPKLLEKIEPNMELVKTLLTHQDLLNPKTRILARKIIDKVVQQLKEKMKIQVEQSITGAIRRDKHSPRKVFRNLDLSMTIRRNLKNYDTDSGKLLVDQQTPMAHHCDGRPVGIDAGFSNLFSRDGINLCRVASGQDVDGFIRHRRR